MQYRCRSISVRSRLTEYQALANINPGWSLDLDAGDFGSYLHRLDAVPAHCSECHTVLIVETILKIAQKRRDGYRIGEILEISIAAGLLADLHQARLREIGGVLAPAI